MKLSIMAAAGLVVFAACSDVEGPDVDSAPRLSREERVRRPVVPSAPEDSKSSGGVADMAARKWFRIDIEAGTTLEPDALIELTVTYTANFATHDADLFVTLPEIESAKLSEWGYRYRKPLATRRAAKVASRRWFAARAIR